jgi:outer membrane protein assembly factor BamB
MSRPLAIILLFSLALVRVSAQTGAAPTLPPRSTGPLTKTTLPIADKKALRNNPTGGETFDLDPVLKISLDAPPAVAAAFDAHAAYVALRSGTLVAIDLDAGKVRWRHDLAATQPPAVGDGLVVVAGDELLAAFDAATGEAKWSVPVAGGFSAPPLLDSGWVVATATATDVLVIRAADGKVLWTRSLGAAAVVRPFIAGDGVYFSLADNRVVALALQTGEPRWERTLPGKPGDLMVLDDRLFVGADDKYFYCLNIKHGKNRWRWRTGGRPVGPAAVDEKHVYYIGLDNILWALDRNGGTLKWKAEMPVRPSGGPIVLGTVVVVAAVQEEVYGYRAATGAALGKASYSADLAAPPQILAGPSPALSGIALMTREGSFQILRRRLEPTPIQMPYPLGEEVPLSVLGAPLAAGS